MHIIVNKQTPIFIRIGWIEGFLQKFIFFIIKDSEEHMVTSSDLSNKTHCEISWYSHWMEKLTEQIFLHVYLCLFLRRFLSRKQIPVFLKLARFKLPEVIIHPPNSAQQITHPVDFLYGIGPFYIFNLFLNIVLLLSLKSIWIHSHTSKYLIIFTLEFGGCCYLSCLPTWKGWMTSYDYHK